MNMILGSPIALIATDNLLFIPPLNELVLAFFTSERPTSASSSSVTPSISSVGTPLI
jgi:hypothetical protein